MSTPTLTALPCAAPAPGWATDIPTWDGPLVSPMDLAFRRAVTTPDYFGWLAHVASAAGCAHPIRLAGRISTIDAATGAELAPRDRQTITGGQTA